MQHVCETVQRVETETKDTGAPAGAENAAAGSARAAITTSIRNLARSVLSVVPRIPAVKFFRPKASSSGEQRKQVEHRLANFMVDAAAGSVVFTTYGATSWMLGDSALTSLPPAAAPLHSVSSDFLSGACGGVLHGVIVCPYENWRKTCRGSVTDARALWRNIGQGSFAARASFRGVGAVARRDALGFGTFFSVYHSIVGHDRVLRIDDWPSTARVLVAGGLSGVSYSLVYALCGEGWRGVNMVTLRRLAWGVPAECTRISRVRDGQPVGDDGRLADDTVSP